MVKVGISLNGLQPWLQGDIKGLIELVEIADRCGVDFMTVPDHLALSENTDKYPYGKFPGTPNDLYYEPVTLISALAARTQHIRFMPAILLAPLRPALFLAKQLATLDLVSGGRTDMGVGAGWHKEEFDAVGLPWVGRFDYLDEQLRACKVLWSESPASFDGKWIKFQRLSAKPFPIQPGGIPFFYGVAPTERNFRRIAELGNGWFPIESDPDVLAGHIRELRAAFVRQGRDPSDLSIVGTPRLKRVPDQSRLEATLKEVPAFVKAGVESVVFHMGYFCQDLGQFEKIVRQIVTLK